jgi:hypothetical protein
MRNFRLFFIFTILFCGTILLYSCLREESSITQEARNIKLESRSLKCPEPILSLVTIPNTPCADLKLVYNGTNDPFTTCTLKGFQIKIFKTWDINDVKEFNSPFFNSPGNTRYPINTSWVSTLGGELVNINNGPELGVFNVNPELLNINDSFEYFIQSSTTRGPKTWVCIETVFDCDGEECKSNKCFDAWTPCI